MADCFYAEAEQVRGNKIYIEESESRHMTRVMRLKAGSRVSVKVFARMEYECVIESISERQAVLLIEKEHALAKKTEAKRALILSPPRPQVLSSLIPKLVELDLDILLPVATERAFIKNAEDFNISRYQRLIPESMKQCGRSFPLELRALSDFDDWVKGSTGFFDEFQNWRLVFPFEGSADNLLKPVTPDKDTVFFIGPEGGFTSDEALSIQERGFETVSLAKHILKVETAVMAALLRCAQ